jgi:predicted transcriptional regulator
VTVDPLGLETRRRVYRRVADRPGSYLRELQRDLGMAMGALEYHLDQLVKAGLLSVVDEANKRFFPTTMDARDKRVVAFLRQTLPRRALLVTLEHRAPCTKAVLLQRLDVPPSTLNHHLAHLVGAGLLAEQRQGHEVAYHCTDPERVLRLLVACRAGLVDRMVDGFLEGIDALR